MKNNQYLITKFLACLIFGIMFLSFSVSKVSAATVLGPVYGTSPPAGYVRAPESEQYICGSWTSTCWNSWAPAQTDCGTPCTAGNAWTRYSYSGCYYDAFDPSNYLPVYLIADNVCSTGDKYNSGNPPVMNAGYCNCTVGGGYKTCCNGTSLANARPFPVDPYAPDEADCGGYTTVRCGGGGEPACGQAACDTLTPPPPAAPNCDSGISCSGTCTATSSNTCSNNGTQSGCSYTAYSGGGTCTQVAAPSQTCSVDNCSAGNTCVGGICTTGGGGGGGGGGGQVCDPFSPGPICDTAYCSSDYSVCGQGRQYCLWDGSDYGPCSEEVNNCASQCTEPTPSPSPSPCVGPGCEGGPIPRNIANLVCKEYVSTDGGNWLNSVTANPGQQINFKMEISNSGNGIPWYGTRNKFDEIIGGFTNIWQNTDPSQAYVPWLIYANQPWELGFPGIYRDNNYYDWGAEFGPGSVDTTYWSEVLKEGARTFKNQGYAAVSLYTAAGNYIFPGGCNPDTAPGNQCCWTESLSGGQTCISFAPSGGCNPSYTQGCTYTGSFQCNSVTVSTFYPVSGYVKNSQTKAGIPNVQIQVYDNNLPLPPPQKTKTVSTGPNGRFIVDNFVRRGDSYAVRVPGNSHPQTAPTGYAPPAKTSTIGWTWNWALNSNPPNNPQADTPIGSLSYEGQKAGSGIDCAGPNGAGVDNRCSFEYDPLTNNAQYVSRICPPANMTPGQTANVSVTMKNIGNTTWTTGNLYSLGSQTHQDNTFWGLKRIPLGGDVPPGSNNAFNRTVTAPATAGTYNFQWRMIQEKVEWFGETSLNCPVIVGTSDLPPPGGANTPWIQTTGGDVHSNTRINTPGGP